MNDREFRKYLQGIAQGKARQEAPPVQEPPPERERATGGGKPASSAPAKKNVDDLDDDIPF